MSAATIRLERFDRSNLGAGSSPRISEAIEQARLEGYRQGQDDARAAELATLTTALIDCSEKLADESLIRLSARQDVARSIGPLLEALIQAIGPAGYYEQFEAFLTDHLAHLSLLPDQRKCTIRCPADLGSQLGQILQKYNLKHILIEPLPDGITAVTVSSEGGEAIFDPQDTINIIRQLTSNMAKELKS